MRNQYKVLQERYNGVNESEAPFQFDRRDTESFYKRFDNLMKGFPGLNYFLKHIARTWDIPAEDKDEAYHVLAAYWEQWYDRYVDKVKVSPQEAERLTDVKIKGLYTTFLTSPEGKEWEIAKQAKPEYEKGAKETGWDIQNTIDEDEESSKEYENLEDTQNYKDAVAGLIKKPGFKFFFDWLLRSEEYAVQDATLQGFGEWYFLNSVENYVDAMSSDDSYDDMSYQEKDLEAIDSAEERILRDYNWFISRGKETPEYKAWKEYEATKGIYKGKEKDSGWAIGNIM